MSFQCYGFCVDVDGHPQRVMKPPVLALVSSHHSFKKHKKMAYNDSGHFSSSSSCFALQCFVSVSCFVCVYSHCSDQCMEIQCHFKHHCSLFLRTQRHFYLFLSASMILLLFVCCHDDMKLFVSRIQPEIRMTYCTILFQLIFQWFRFLNF